MQPVERFSEVLARYVTRSGYTAGQLARLSGIPKPTIVNWMVGRVKKPRDWRPLVHLAAILRLSEAEAMALLQSAGHPSIVELVARADNRQDRSLLAPWAEAVRQRFERAPFQAIADLPHFVGRAQELQDLENVLLDVRGGLYSFQGMGGMGKTALAAHVTYHLRPYFPDGVLWARVDTADPMSILSTFANAYGSDVSQYTDLDSRSRVVRELLADKRALVVLDNVWSSEDVKPLLPPTGTCTVILTTRRHDLSITRGARRFHIGPFNQEEEALALFAKILGPEPVQRERVALAEIAEILGYLPLAVDIVASRLAYEPGWSAADLAARLRQEKKRLDELAYEDLDVRLSISMSYQVLSPDQQRFFTTLGVFGGEDLDVTAAAYVAAMEVEAAKSTLRKLYGLSLVQQGRPGCYRLHPLLRDYARERIEDDAVFERMVEFYVRFAEDHAGEYDVLDLEADSLFTALQVAFDRGMSMLLVRGANALYNYLETRGLYALAEMHLGRAADAARSLEYVADLVTTLRNLGRIVDRRGEYGLARAYWREGLVLAREIGHDEEISVLLQGLSVVAFRLGDYGAAETYSQEGLSLARAQGQHRRIGTLLLNLGVMAGYRGDYAQAEVCFQEGLDLARELGYEELICRLLTNLGAIAEGRGDYAQAEAYFQEGLSLARELGHREVIGILLGNLGEVACHLGNHLQARAYHQEGLALAREIGHREGIISRLTQLGKVLCCLGDHAQAEACLQESLNMAREISYHRLVCDALNEWGELYCQQQRYDSASETFSEALELACELDFRDCTAMALYGLARVAMAQNDPTEARRQGQKSLSILEAIGHGKTGEVEAWLNGLSEMG